MDGEYEPYHENREVPKCGLKQFSISLDTLQVGNPDGVFALGISMQRKYAKGFLENGTIKFGCPKKWIDEAAKSPPGRADIQEGVFAAYSLDDQNGIIQGLKENRGSYHIRLQSSHSDLVYLVDSKVIELPTYCMYTIRFRDFKIYPRGDKYIAHAHIPFRYFRALGNGKSWEQAKDDDPDEKYIFMTIYDDEEFLRRISSKLKEIGLSDGEILYGYINYRNIDIPFPKLVPHPFELFMKNEQFDDQHESRLVLNVKNDEKRKYLLNNTIDIGPLDDICVFDDFYHGGGMNFFIELEV